MARNRQRDQRSDGALVDICNHGDARAAAAAFEALYLRHKDYVLRVALRFSPDIDTALDVLQDTFVQLLRGFPPTGEGITLSARLTTLLYPIAKNTAITAARKVGRFPAADDVTPDDVPVRPVRDDGDLGRILANLPSGQREALTLRFVDGMSLDEDETRGQSKITQDRAIGRHSDDFTLTPFVVVNQADIDAFAYRLVALDRDGTL